MNEIRCLIFFLTKRLPFIKTICQDKAALVPVTAAKGRFLCERFAAGIDQAAANGWVFGPHGDQAPHKKVGPKFIIVWNCQNWLRRCDIKARCELFWKGIVTKSVLQVSRVCGQCKSSTHTYSFLSDR